MLPYRQHLEHLVTNQDIMELPEVTQDFKLVYNADLKQFELASENRPTSINQPAEVIHAEEKERTYSLVEDMSKDSFLEELKRRSLMELSLPLEIHGDITMEKLMQPELKINHASSSEKTIDTVSKKAKNFHCPECPAAYVCKAKLKYHLMVHTGERPFECNVCKNRFRHKQHLEVHSALHSGAKPNQCVICKEKFKWTSSLRSHYVTQHKSDNIAVPKGHKCGLCEIACSTPSQLKRHMTKHTGEKSFQCDQCPMRFSCNGKRDRHLLTHMSMKPFKCHLCPIAYCRKDKLEEHIKSEHEGIKRQCKHCHRLLFTHSGLKKHLEKSCPVLKELFEQQQPSTDQKSSGNDPVSKRKSSSNSEEYQHEFQCDVCPKTFKLKKYLMSHMGVHSGELPFPCTYCDKRFRRKTLLQIHLANTHFIGDEKFKCPDCPARFIQSIKLKRHRVLHNRDLPRKCGQCTATFANITYLQKHLKMHENWEKARDLHTKLAGDDNSNTSEFSSSN